ncbi:MAG: NUDIX hydrolase [Candidatus Eremiobacteraeota bacterium]|nr:NUDIX hydrolase [Candidatus Eremiobacteraeota bacterium]MBC5803743.1 NUDIX hydrolase [Candidatus Eremiobacteraeota bacterium]MBC5820438.1 NUDIX hydrolase [Candidatus Eremiobacteraeota bacterium]
MKAARAPGWRIVDSKMVIDTPHLRLRRDEIELPSGKRVGPYYVRESRGFAVVFAVTADERVVLVHQYKHGIGRHVLELPAGGIDPDETPQGCARRELAEETGYVGDPAALELLGTYVFDPTSSTTTYHLYLARNAHPLLPQRCDDTEDITLELATFEQIRRYVANGTIDVGIHIASIYIALEHLGKR